MVVERIDKPNNPVKFTQYLCEYTGWTESNREPASFDRVIYLGRCVQDGDMFACYDDDHILIFKGHLNSGTY